jgi:hypothetical protein
MRIVLSALEVCQTSFSSTGGIPKFDIPIHHYQYDNVMSGITLKDMIDRCSWFYKCHNDHYHVYGYVHEYNWDLQLEMDSHSYLHSLFLKLSTRRPH